jgi:diguanylate cyclase (GGDEF)-like protein
MSEQTTVLVVDDERDIQNFLRFALQKIGYRIFLASDGHEAIRMANAHKPDLIILDIMMPNLNGFETCDYFKSQIEFREIPIIFMSALGALEDKIKAYKCGASDYLTKPVDVITVAARVKSILQIKKLENSTRKEIDEVSTIINPFDYRHLYERLDIELEKSRKGKIPLSLIYLDVDYMKIINSEYGYRDGDHVVRQMSDYAFKEAGDRYLVITSNSDKLMVICPDTDEKKADLFASRLMHKIGEIYVPIEQDVSRSVSSRKVTASIGLVTWDKWELVSPQKILSLVEKALRKAKESGRSKKVQYQFFTKNVEFDEHPIDKIVEKDYKED